VLQASEVRTVEALSEALIPRTETPGARDAQVSRYIDRMLHDGVLGSERAAFLGGLQEFEASCRERYGVGFADLPQKDQSELVGRWSDEGKPFFRQMKDLTVRGYYTSREGLLQELEYKGNGAHDDYPGCTHTEHWK
jgi:hypothetical protein